MNMKVKLRNADITIAYLDKQVIFWRNLAIIFGLGCIALGIAIIGIA